MTTEGFKRKLTTMFSADVAGYSRLMGEDEAATVKTITAYRNIMAELIKQHRGRVVDSPGDNVLAEFTSVVDAVQCAVAVQKEFQARNAELPEDRRMEFRIGINLGDVIEEEDRIYGDGVNIAARLEALADPGGICISKTAFDQIETKLPLGYEYLGEQTVKNIAKPVGAYQVLMEPRVTVAGKEEKVLPLPEEPSIAVLPFANISGDPEQEYFSDGLTEEIITALSKVDKIFVIASNSTFSYKGKPVKVQQVGEELGVRYVLEGSVRKAGDRVRITAQLIDALTGHHLWAERYDRDLKDIFALQDEITMRILTALRVTLTEGEQARMYDKGTENLDSFLKVLQGMHYLLRFNEDDNVVARQMFEEAVPLDPENPVAHTMLGWTHVMDVWYGSSESPGKSMERASELAQKAIALDETQDSAHSLLGHIYLMMRQYDMAIAEGERAVALNPNGADAHAHLAMTLNYVGRREEAIALFKKAIRLNPMPPNWYLTHLAFTYRLTGKNEEA
ncbi:MAG: adenylate/guanylate cyclase domain-containing protein, partial [Proteobacteria bacterium]|nr:adenylate/guanylate cyclase domain-containing protein [Pseudomonadota bacterium]